MPFSPNIPYAVDVDQDLQPASETSEEDALLGDRPNDHASDAQGTRNLQTRQLGFFSVVLLICNRIVGTGIFATPALILQSAGSVGSSLVLWVVGACIAAAGTAVYVEFGTGIPRSGGELNYLGFLFTKPPYLIISMYAVYATTMGWAAGNSIICGEYTLHALGIPTNQWNQRLIAFCALTAGVVLHGSSVKWGLKVQNMLGLSKVAVLAAISLAGLAVLTGFVSVGNLEHSPAKENFTRPFQGSTSNPNALVTGLYKVIWSFVGYANANAALSEVKNPVKTITRAAPIGVAVVSVLYIAVNFAYFSAVSKTDMLSGGTTVAAQFFRNVFGASAETILSIFIAMSAFGAVLSVLFSLGRINQEVAREGIIPFASVIASTSRFGTPLAGLVLHWVACVAIVIAAPPGDAYNMIINVISYPLSIINAAISGGLILLYLRVDARKWDPPVRAGLSAVVFFFAANVFLAVAPLVPPAAGAAPYKNLPYWLHVVVGVLLFALGGAYWLCWSVVMPCLGRYELTRTLVVQPEGGRIAVFAHTPRSYEAVTVLHVP